MKNRFIGTHTKCANVAEVAGRMRVCGRSYGHDDPKTRKNPSDHYDPDSELTWPSKKLRSRR